MHKILYSTSFAALLILSACRLSETKEALPKQTVDLFVRYLQPEKEYKAEAILLEGDSLPLAKSIRFANGIRFIDKEMNETQVTENLLRYSTQFGGEYASQASFVFRDKSGNTYTIPLSMEPLGDIEVTMPSEPDGQMNLNISSGGVLKPDENLVLVLTDRSGQASTVTIEGPSTSGTYALSMVLFGNPVKGNAELYLVKKQLRNEQKGKLTVHLVEELYSASLVVKVP
ncbi:hypothetical protein [Haliscomenobacter hydrossis]|uniref:Lipoprotein n=1 Tax=Haliscomenobacter hydrossis (strain ATCC 27775 / DSM 1100 / LMG 10767 / O) TaxID=760192 RepID=F4KT50_HALH1|nr:hypothetical protein [Haliscomenobacter hydrossis]AEE50120.1 hypothetical protein Halhy_2239 [Haliscomenobacter hydrossis DSM 1100]